MRNRIDYMLFDLLFLCFCHSSIEILWEPAMASDGPPERAIPYLLIGRRGPFRVLALVRVR
jgi:hypothetical protein